MTLTLSVCVHECSVHVGVPHTHTHSHTCVKLRGQLQESGLSYSVGSEVQIQVVDLGSKWIHWRAILPGLLNLIISYILYISYLLRAKVFVLFLCDVCVMCMHACVLCAEAKVCGCPSLSLSAEPGAWVFQLGWQSANLGSPFVPTCCVLALTGV